MSVPLKKVLSAEHYKPARLQSPNIARTANRIARGYKEGVEPGFATRAERDSDSTPPHRVRSSLERKLMMPLSEEA